MCWHYKLLLKYVFILPGVEFAYKLEWHFKWAVICAHYYTYANSTCAFNMKRMHTFCCTNECLMQAVCVCWEKPVLYFHIYCTVLCAPSLLVYIEMYNTDNVYVYYFSLTFTCTCQHQCPKTTPTRSKLAWSIGACQCPFLSQQHVHCLNCATVTHPVFPSPGGQPSSSSRRMTLLSGMLKIPNLPASVCEFKSQLLKAELGFQLMTQSYRGSMHWWSGVRSHCTSLVVHFLIFLSAPPSDCFSAICVMEKQM